MLFAQLPPPTPPPEVRPQRPYKVTLTLTDPNQLQVQVGQSLSVGSILAKRTDPTLELKRAQLLARLESLDSRDPPDDFFRTVRLRELEYQRLRQEYETQYNLVTRLTALPDPPPSLQRQELNTLHSLYSRLQLAHERLAQAHREATRQQRNDQLTTEQQKADLTHQVQLLEHEIALTTIRSPVAGTVSRIQFTSQTNQTLHVEIQITPR
ncbi:MAG: hypothetical protein Q6M54_05740 [Thermostichus sp. DRC_bins_24]